MILRNREKKQVNKLLKFKSILLPVLILLLMLTSTSFSEDLPPLPLNASYLIANSVQPEVIIDTGGRRQGRFRMMDQWWWMSFLHIRPLAGTENLDAEYTRNLVLHAWKGNSESNKLTGQEGVLEIGGIPVYWAEGILMDGRIKARYYVWDDSSSGRRFISDTNIYRRYLTPDSLLTVVQKEMTEYMVLSSIGKEYLDENKRNWQGETKNFDKFGLSILHPYDASVELLPGGADKKRGKEEEYNSLWILPVGSNWRYDLSWGLNSEESVKEMVSRLLPDSLVVRDSQNKPDVKVKVSDIVEHSEIHWSGNAKVTITTNDHKDIKNWHFHLARWEWGHQHYNALLAVESYDKWRNLKFDGEISSNNEYDRKIMFARWSKWIKSIDHTPDSMLLN